MNEVFPDWHPVPWSKAECQVCQMHLDTSKEAKLEQRKKAENEKVRKMYSVSGPPTNNDIFQALLSRLQTDNLFGRKSLLGERECAIVPSDFIRAWRSWLSKPGDTSRPISLDNSYLFCEHGKLLVDFNDTADFGDDLAVVSKSEWETLTTLCVLFTMMLEVL